MKAKIIETAAPVSLTKEKLKKTDSIRLELIENNLKWFIVVGSIACSIAIWGYKELSNRIDKIDTKIDALDNKINALENKINTLEIKWKTIIKKL